MYSTTTSTGYYSRGRGSGGGGGDVGHDGPLADVVSLLPLPETLGSWKRKKEKEG